ncbi:MAG TPA: hypothetical protein VIJ33_08910 [Solirubrobacteraceae bacterium]
MSSALDQFERSLVAASRALHALDHSASTETNATDPGRPPASSRRRNGAFGQRRLMLSLAALVVAAGGVAAARSLLWPSQRLADGTVYCFDGPSGTGISSKSFASRSTPNGQLPISICRRWYRINRYRFDNRPTGRLVADLPVIACQQNATTVAVYIATGQSDQCRRLGEKLLPATYAVSAARLRVLQRTLVAIQAKHDCVSPRTLAKQARDVLHSQDFQGWRVITPQSAPAKSRYADYVLPAGTGGTCGMFGMGDPPTYNDVNIDTHHQSVGVSLAPPRSIGLKLQHIDYELYTTTYQHCFTATSVRALVRQWFASTPLRPHFATANTSDGSTYEPRSQRLYDQGCVRFDAEIPGNNNRFVDVLLNARNAPKLPARQFYPPASAFHP